MQLVEEIKQESLSLSIKAHLSIGEARATTAGLLCTGLLAMVTNQLFDCFSTKKPPSMPQTFSS